MYPERGESEIIIKKKKKKDKKDTLTTTTAMQEIDTTSLSLRRQVGIFMGIILPRVDADSYTFNYAYNKDR